MKVTPDFVDYLSQCIASEYFYIQEKYKNSKIIGCEVIVDGDVVSAFIRFSLKTKDDLSKLQWGDFNHDIYLTSKESLSLNYSMVKFGKDFLKFNEEDGGLGDQNEIRDRNIEIYINGLINAKKITSSDAIFYFCEDGEEKLKILSLPKINGDSYLVNEYLRLRH